MQIGNKIYIYKLYLLSIFVLIVIILILYRLEAIIIQFMILT